MDGHHCNHFDATAATTNMTAAAAWEDSSQQESPSGSGLDQYKCDNFAQQPYFYTTSESSGDALFTSSPDSSSYASPSASVVTKVKNSVPDKLERRREQNRSSQRAYRERRERQQRELEAQIVRWQHEYQNLLRMFHQQSNELARSGAIIQQLEGTTFRLQHTIRHFSCGCISRAHPEINLESPVDMNYMQRMHNPYPRM